MSAKKCCLISRDEIARRVAELAEANRPGLCRPGPGDGGGAERGVYLPGRPGAGPALPGDRGFCPGKELRRRHRVAGEIQVTKDVEEPLKGRDVVIVEDIIDLGLTLDFLRQHLLSHRPRSLKICCLIDKRERRQVEVPLDYTGFVVEKGFLLGYGLDCGEGAAPCRRFLSWRRNEDLWWAAATLYSESPLARDGRV